MWPVQSALLNDFGILCLVHYMHLHQFTIYADVICLHIYAFYNTFNFNQLEEITN